MKARLVARSLVALAALVAAAEVANAQAPVTRTPPRPDTPRLMVHVFGSQDHVAGPQASDELRERLIRAFPSRILWVIDSKDIKVMMDQSGYDTTVQLQPSDEMTLAKQQRADEYIRGRVVKNGAEYRVDAWLVLTRDNSLMQPLPASTGNRPDRAVAGLVRSIQDARKQLDDEKKCMNLARDNKLAEALAAADAGVVEYPQSTLVRYCKMNVLARQKASDTAMIAIANEILAIDSVSKNALAVAADANKRLGNTAAANDLYIRLLAANPTDAELQKTVIEALASSGDFRRAKELVVSAVAQNPGDMALIQLLWNILVASKDWKEAARVGEEMVTMDTSLATVPFFQRLVGVYDADSQPQKASEAAARATQKFAADAELWQMYSGTLKKAGQVQQSIAAAKRALEINPQIPNGWYQVAVAYNELGMPDSALVALRASKAAGDDADNIGQLALVIGNRLYRAAVADSVKTVARFQAAQPYLYYAADSSSKKPEQQNQAALLVGVTHLYIAQVLAQGLQASKSCDEAKAGQAAVTESQIFTMRAGRSNPQQAGQVMGGLNTLGPYFEQSIKALCK